MVNMLGLMSMLMLNMLDSCMTPTGVVTTAANSHRLDSLDILNLLNLLLVSVAVPLGFNIDDLLLDFFQSFFFYLHDLFDDLRGKNFDPAAILICLMTLCTN